MIRSIWLSLFCLAVSVPRLPTAYTLGNETDRLALMALTDQMTPHPPGFMSSWNDSQHFCSWGGVTCSRRHQRVVTLSLASQGLRGSISPYVGNLSFLRYVSLANNSLQGQIPQEIGYLSRLRLLYISNNNLSGPVPVNLSQCTNLVTLRLHGNNLTGKIPEELDSCTKLNNLVLERNSLTGTIPVSFGNLTSLLSLHLQDNYLYGTIPSSLSRLKRLQILALSGNSFSGPMIYNISSLSQFVVTDNRLEGHFPHDIGLTLPRLTMFGVAENKFTGPIPASLFSNSSSIELLDLSRNGFSGNIPVEIGKLKNVRFLSLAQNSLGSDLGFLAYLNNCSSLRLLDIGYNFFEGSLPASITNLSVNLDSLFIGFNQITGSIPTSIENLVNLIVFSATSNLLTGSIPTSIGMIQNLQSFRLAGNRLSGRIPYSIGNITSLYSVDLSQNALSGSVVTSFEKCRNLQRLYLDCNNLTGAVPKQVLGSSRHLLEINLSHNHFNGSLPLEIGSLSNLYSLDVSENKLVGEIPRTLGGCAVLEQIHLQGNFLQGTIPPSLSFLKGIQVIDLSRNNLSGKILEDLQGLMFLKNLNLSFNDFDGEVPTRGIFRNASQYSVSENRKLCGGLANLNLPSCIVEKSKHDGLPFAVKVVLAIILPLVVIASLLLALYWRRSKSTSKLQSEADQSPENNLQRVSYNELCDATNGFSPENLIGVGSFGSVYKGVLRNDECPIAVKVVNLVVQGSFKSFMAECDVLRGVRHRNLLKISTVCSSFDVRGNDFKAIVYQLMPNGSLESWLHTQEPSKNLNLSQRLNIAIDIASALDYLHNGSPTPIIHCDMKPSNVLLDADMVACVGDFGLAKFLHKDTSNSDKSYTNSIAVRGTIGYIPPEYGMGGEVTTEGDVYSYGIMLLELFTGKRPTDEMLRNSSNIHNFCKSDLTHRLMEIIDAQLLEETTDEPTAKKIEEQRGLTSSMKACLISVLEVGLASSSESASERMGIKDVLSKLQKTREAYCNFIGLNAL